MTNIADAIKVMMKNKKSDLIKLRMERSQEC